MVEPTQQDFIDHIRSVNKEIVELERENSSLINIIKKDCLLHGGPYVDHYVNMYDTTPGELYIYFNPTPESEEQYPEETRTEWFKVRNDAVRVDWRAGVLAVDYFYKSDGGGYKSLSVGTMNISYDFLEEIISEIRREFIDRTVSNKNVIIEVWHKKHDGRIKVIVLRFMRYAKCKVEDKEGYLYKKITFTIGNS